MLSASLAPRVSDSSGCTGGWLTGQGDECVGLPRHLRLPLVHVGHRTHLTDRLAADLQRLKKKETISPPGQIRFYRERRKGHGDLHAKRGKKEEEIFVAMPC